MDANVTGAKVFCYLFNNPKLPLTETIVNMWIAIAIILGVCIWLTHSLSVHPTTKRQIVAELIVGLFTKLVDENMGKKWRDFIPFIASIFLLATVCNLMGLTGAFSPTGDLNTLVGWALLVFILIIYWKIRLNGFGGYLKSFIEPMPFMLPLNIIGDIATPVSMALRHFANVVAGTVIMTLFYAALGSLNQSLFGLIPGIVGDVLGAIPFLEVGVPGILQVYFGVFSGLVQPYIFCMLTMIFVAQTGDRD